jgi:hypothetical protein
VYVKAGIIKIAFKQKTSFFNKAKIFAEGKIGKCVIYKEKTEPGDRHPEQHLGDNLRRFLKGDYSGILHTAGL